jgi:hypothetical protein
MGDGCRSPRAGRRAHYLAQYEESPVAKAALISAVPLLMINAAAKCLPKEVFDGLQGQLVTNRSQLYRNVPAGPAHDSSPRPQIGSRNLRLSSTQSSSYFPQIFL